MSTNIQQAERLVNLFLEKSKPAPFYYSEEKVHAIGIVLIATAVIALSVIAYFGMTRGFTDVRIIAGGSSFLFVLVMGIFLSFKTKFWNDPLFIAKQQKEAIPYLLENGAAALIYKFKYDTIKIFNKKQMLEILSQTDLKIDNGRCEYWDITLKDQCFIKIKAQVQGGTNFGTISEFTALCNNFEPAELYRGHMVELFAFIDSNKKLQEKLAKDLLQFAEVDNFNEFFSRWQKLENKLQWSFLDLLTIKVQKKIFLLYFQTHYTLDDFATMCKDYWEIAKRLLPSEVVGKNKTGQPDPKDVKQNWDNFSNQ